MNFKRKLCYIGLGAIIDFVVILSVVLTNNGSTSINEQVKSSTTSNMRSQEVVTNIDKKVNQSEEIEEKTEEIEEKTEEIEPIEKLNNDVEESFVTLDETNVVEEIEDEPSIVYDNMTLDELAEKLNRSLNSTISGKGYLIASYSLEKGVDPYLATGIILLETGCTWECSTLVQSCNNVGGQKGSGCGSYRAYDTLDEGIRGFIDNLYNNYYSYGLTTPEQMNAKYAESTEWSAKVNNYIEKIKAA